jgi:hypothetical protein
VYDETKRKVWSRFFFSERITFRIRDALNGICRGAAAIEFRAFFLCPKTSTVQQGIH